MTESKMHATTLWQPYATLLALRVKKYETRHYPPPASLIGKRIAIHAAKRQPPISEIRATPQTIIDALGGRGWASRIPYSAVLGTAVLKCSERVARYGAGEVQLENGVVFPDDGFGDYRVGRFCWELADVIRFEEPIPASGSQGFWFWTPPA